MTHPWSMLIVLLLVLFAIYRRVRRNIGFQKLNRRGLKTRTIIFAIVGLVALGESINFPVIYIFDFAGILIGLILTYYAMGTSRFESRDESWYYHPNGWVGAIVLVLLLARLITRFYELYTMAEENQGMLTDSGAAAGMHPGAYLNDPWGAGIIFITLTYYTGYSYFLLRKEKQLSAEDTAEQEG